MIYVFENQNNNASWVIGRGLSIEDKERGIQVESLPEKEVIEGKYAILKADKLTGEVWYEYKEVAETEEDLTKEEVSQLKLDNAELMMKSAIQEIELNQSKQDIGELMIKVATLEMGGNL